MADPRLILGRIVSVEGTTPGPASGITYTIAVHDPQVEGIFRLERQKPVQRWPDEIDVEALEPGQLVIGAMAANAVQWHFHEYPAFRACATTPATSQLLEQSEIIARLVQQGGGQPPSQSVPDINPD